MSSSDFDALCDGPLAPALAGLEEQRKAALKKHWVTIGIAAVIAIAALILLRFGFLGWVIAVAALIGGWIFASGHLSKAGRSLKDPALQAITGARGMTYSATGFTADGYEALHPLFGRPNSRSFSDRFTGDEGGPFAFYESLLVSGSGKSRREVFRGLIFSLRRNLTQGETVIVPDKGLFNFFKPGGGMERVKFEDDGDFEKRFEVYSTRPDEARALLNPIVRERLKAWRETYGKVIVRIAGEEVAVALTKRHDHFEVGSMTKAIPGRDRVRGIWNDVDETVGVVRDIRSTLG